MAVVHFLEVVEVEQHERQRAAAPRRLREHPGEGVGDGPLVREAGETVGRGADLGDREVAKVREHGRRLAHRVADALAFDLVERFRAVQEH